MISPLFSQFEQLVPCPLHYFSDFFKDRSKHKHSFQKKIRGFISSDITYNNYFEFKKFSYSTFNFAYLFFLLTKKNLSEGHNLFSKSLGDNCTLECNTFLTI